VSRAVRALAAVLVAGCAARQPTAPLTPAVRALDAEIDSTLAAPEWARAMWGVVVQSLDRGDVLYRRNAERLFKPASNLKIVTGASALVTLGPDFRYRTPVLARGHRSADTLAGDLVVIGRGDPSLSQHVAGGTDVLAALRPWADSVAARGIHVIAGRVSGDASWFPDPVLGEGWMWDDLPYDYSAPVGALEFNEGSAIVEVTPAAAGGAPAIFRLLPSRAPLRVFVNVRTVPADSGTNLDWTRAPFGDSVSVTGQINVGHAPFQAFVSVPDPTRFFEAALTQALEEAGIRVLGAGCGVLGNCTATPPSASTTSTQNPAPSTQPSPGTQNPAPDTLFIWQSLPLRDLLPFFEKPSQNQIGEALLRTLGGVTRGVASRDSGLSAVRDVLRGFGVPDDAWRIVDGSGVSHYNYVAPDLLAHTLIGIARRPDADVFINALPIAGVDGTLERRLRGTAAQGNVHAKTGDISGARTLSGYVTTRDGERFVFVLMANHFTVPSRIVDVAADHIVERLANFSRQQR
jgi:serine-type D-Ala-D-Ala carboxypeptidase/endopeptidase (penicillin-binding protein 4)